MLRGTELEHRLGAMRTFMAMLLAHLEDNGLIDRLVLEEDFRKVQAIAGANERSREDMNKVFAMADTMIAGWQGQRDAQQAEPRGVV